MTTKGRKAWMSKVFYILWDNECQCELLRGDDPIQLDEDGMIFGSGSHNIYPCFRGFHITKVQGREEGGFGLRITYEEDPPQEKSRFQI